MADHVGSVVTATFPNRDGTWERLRDAASRLAESEPALASFVHATILAHERMEQALAYHLSQKLANADVGSLQVHEVIDRAYSTTPALGNAARADLTAIFERDPAVDTLVEPFLFFKGYHALQAYRVTHWLWTHGRTALALHLQSRISEVFAVDIHPAARIGQGVMIDHGTGVVIGETAVVEDDVSLLQGVTLGGTGKEHGDRHPKIRRGVMIGAGAKILGNTEIGAYSRIGAGSVVLRPVPPGSTAVGVPARVIGGAGCNHPAQEMNQLIDLSPEDYVI